MSPPGNTTPTTPTAIEKLALTAWGKLGSKEKPHALICHALDTYAAAEALYEVFLGPEVRRELEEGLASLADPGLEPEEAKQQVRAWIFLLCALHDLGKLSPAFQALEKDRARDYIPEEFHASLEGDWCQARHERVTAVHLETWLKELSTPWSAKINIIDALGGHHGWLPRSKQTEQAEDQAHSLGDERWERARYRFIELVAGVFDLAPYTDGWRGTRLSPAAAVGLAGLTMVSDWTASDETTLKGESYPRRSSPTVQELSGYLASARTWIQVNLSRVNWVPWEPPADPSFKTLFPKQKHPRPLQRAVSELLESVDEPGILVAQAPTGEGKTKAGLLASTTLAARLGLTGAYLAFPDRSLARDVFVQANALLETTNSTLRSHLLYAKDPHDPDSDPTRLETLAPKNVCPEEHEIRKWALKTFHVNRGIIFPFGTGTIDQLLKAAIRSKGVTMRLSAVSNKVLFLDEVHSYNAHMSALLEVLLWWCGRMGVPVVMLSATLTDSQRTKLVNSWRNGARLRRKLSPEWVEIPSQATVPWKLTWAEPGKAPKVHPVELSEDNPLRTVVWEPVRNDPQEIATQVLERLSEGGCAAVIRNTKKGAHRVFEALEQQLEARGWRGTATLLHLTGEREYQLRRRENEATLNELRGPESVQRKDIGIERVIAVGTQVLEHGVDVDFDFLVTDPAPVDHLCQRLGRLHRHRGRSRPAPVAEPQALIISGNTPGTFPPGSAIIYPRSLLLATEGLLSERSSITLPHDLPHLVRTAYEDHSSLPLEYGRRVASDELERQRRVDLEWTGAQTLRIDRLADGERINRLNDNSGSNRNTRG